MPNTKEIDGDVYVSSRYLADSTWTGDPALEPLLAFGFDLRHDDLGNVYPEKELTTLEARWHLWGGPKSGYALGYATASTSTPIPLVKAITQSVADPAALPRWKDDLMREQREHQLRPVTRLPPPVPTPLDVRRTTPRRAPALTTRSIPRWTTTTPSAVLPARRSGPRR